MTQNSRVMQESIGIFERDIDNFTEKEWAKFSEEEKDYLSEMDEIKENDLTTSNGSLNEIDKLFKRQVATHQSPILSFLLQSKIFSSSSQKNNSSKDLMVDEYEVSNFKVKVTGQPCNIKHLRYLIGIYRRIQSDTGVSSYAKDYDLMAECGINETMHNDEFSDIFMEDLERMAGIRFTIINKYCKKQRFTFYLFGQQSNGAIVTRDQYGYIKICLNEGLLRSYDELSVDFLNVELFDTIKTTTAQSLYKYYLGARTTKTHWGCHQDILAARLNLEHLDIYNQRKRIVAAHKTLAEMGLIGWKSETTKKTKNTLFSVRFLKSFN